METGSGGAGWEQPGALNGSQLHATAPNSAQQHSPRPAVFRYRRSEAVRRPATPKRSLVRSLYRPPKNLITLSTCAFAVREVIDRWQGANRSEWTSNGACLLCSAARRSASRCGRRRTRPPRLGRGRAGRAAARGRGLTCPGRRDVAAHRAMGSLPRFVRGWGMKGSARATRLARDPSGFGLPSCAYKARACSAG